MYPWLINLGRAVAGATGARGVAKGASKVLKKGPNFDYDKVDGWKRPLWQRPTPVGGGVSRGPGGKFVGGARKQPGWINRMYMNPTTTTGSIARLAGLTAGGSIAADRIASMMEDDEVAPDDAKAMRSAVINSSTPDISKGIQNRLDYQKQMTAKMNKDMKKLIQYYGIVNLVNPDAAPDMLKLGTAMIDQDIKTMGDERQAKIFDSVFANGAPTNAMDAYQRVMQAGGTPEDAEQISGMVADAMPSAPPQLNKSQMSWELTNAIVSSLQSGDVEGAREIASQGIVSKHIDVPGSFGMGLSLEEQVDMLIQQLSGVTEGGSPSMAQGIYDITAG